MKNSRLQIILALLFSFAIQAEDDSNKEEEKKWDVNNPPGETTLATIKTTTGT